MTRRTAMFDEPVLVDAGGLSRRRLLLDCTELLKTAGIPNAAQEAGWLLQHVLDLDPLALHISSTETVPSSQSDRVIALARRRAAREPLQYLLGSQEFCGLEFLVEPGVLIPRPETELLVEEVTRHCHGLRAPLILEIGTGSGCLAVSLAVRLPRARLWVTDVSWSAIALARRNAARHGVLDRVTLIAGDITAMLNGRLDGRAAVVVSNPPYIPDSAFETLQPEVRFEPRQALAGGPDGMAFHRRLVHEAAARLSPSGLLSLEVGVGQAQAVASYIASSGRYNAPRIRPDFAGIDRAVSATRKL